MAFTFAEKPALSDVAVANLASGQILTDYDLIRISQNAAFGTGHVETFYGEYKDGDVIPLPVSSIDGYVYDASELMYHIELRVSTDPSTGKPSARGEWRVLIPSIDYVTGKVRSYLNYYVLGGHETATHDGLWAVWVFAVRGRGKLTLSSIPTFTNLLTSAFALDSAITQSNIQNLLKNSQLAGCRFEVFTDTAGASSAWAATTAYTAGNLVKPTTGRANGLWYKCTIAGTSAAVEPSFEGGNPWPGLVGQTVQDGSVTWIAQGYGYTNGQTVPLPVSPVDGYAYSRSEIVAYVCRWAYAGSFALGTGPPSGNIARLQKSVNTSTGVVSVAVTYWDGSGTTSSADGIIGVVTICQRTLAATPTVAASTFTVVDDSKFYAASKLGDTPIQDLVTNAQFGVLRPEAVLSASLANGNTVALPTGADTYAYARSELIYVWQVSDTQSPNPEAIRAMIQSVDHQSGFVNSLVDYGSVPEGAVNRTNNGVIYTVALGYRSHLTTLILSSPAGPFTHATPHRERVNLVPNGDFSLWTMPLQNVADSWAISGVVGGGTAARVSGWPLFERFSQQLIVAATTDKVGVVSGSIPVAPGWSLQFFMMAKASVATTSGFYIRVHLLDTTRTLDVYFDLWSNVGLGTVRTNYTTRFTIPANGGTAVVTSQGSKSIVGTLNYDAAYVHVELRDDAPNVVSSFTLAHVTLMDVTPISDVIDVAGPNIVSCVRMGGQFGTRACGPASGGPQLGWEGTPTGTNFHHWFPGSGFPYGRFTGGFGRLGWQVENTAGPRVYGLVTGSSISTEFAIADETVATDRVRLNTTPQVGVFGGPTQPLEVFGAPVRSTASVPFFEMSDTQVGGIKFNIASGIPSAGIFSIAQSGVNQRVKIDTTPGVGVLGAPTGAASELAHVGVKQFTSGGLLNIKNVFNATPSTGTPSTSSTSYVVIPELTGTKTTLGGTVLLTAAAAIEAASANAATYFLAFFRDGVQISKDFQAIVLGDTNTPVPIAISTITYLDSPAAGSHTFDVRWKISGTAAIANLGLQRSFQFVELG